ncbi:hypothetical protein N7532_006067 [Penicillium argentinense]|uniref:glucan 1,3-beta-glucosidase n=1 Tax=Penicillium argentinense TaxID=1131581 RepID=A0A9W9FF76_9EURO|nr:uncharacterized protein N7532_006067 [Penicillium argentinense]KAJ5099066.1 hypothetical protein N7532_006067 [Penicillium argentinense]
MHLLILALFGVLRLPTATAYIGNTSTTKDSFVNWRTFTGHGVNLGGWLEQESTISRQWWTTTFQNATDEWSLCSQIGSAQCGAILEPRFKTYIKTDTIDLLASHNVSILRIPTSYAMWISLPGSKLYSGNQKTYLRHIAEYATTTHGMHVILDLHSLPGGTNGLDIGEAVGHWGWWHNSTAMEWSLRAVDAVLEFIDQASLPGSYTLSPINEPVDNRDFSTFGSPAALSEAGARWLVKYIKAVLRRVQGVDGRIPVMFQGSFKEPEYWTKFFTGDENIVLDLHHYYYPLANATAANLPRFICEDAKSSAGDGTFPTFVGEWSIEAGGANELALRGRNLRAGIAAFGRFTRGSSFWNVKFQSEEVTPGEGVKEDYWSYEEFIRQGLLEGEIRDYRSLI